ncbi:enoyl-CoA hydratase/isomerase family protein [Sulfitobacter aestuarii]|uniref:3-hydroxyisobutyryl-CoA hydrolase n=1 Tax=Sulfitobacter aestuarii TaxID=2161676 RepID=A0ABW5U3H6_9RHOB
MSDIDIRVTGRAGRITLTRPQALNALTYEMCLAIEAAIEGWREDGRVALVMLDAAGERAFCSGGDIAELYARGRAGDHAYGQRFWADEYRLNHKLYSYDKPVVSFLQGFTMGGGVGIGCHGSHRVVGESSRIAMPECGIGLVPDVGGSRLLAGAPGRLGEYLGTTGARMAAGDAIRAGFADMFMPEAEWPGLIAALEQTGDVALLDAAAGPAPEAGLAARQAQIDAWFAPGSRAQIHARLEEADGDFAAETLNLFERGAPLSQACALEMLARLRAGGPDMRAALALEYRFTWRAQAQGDFLEGIRAAIIDKDRQPRWQYGDGNVPDAAVAAMLADLGENELNLEE